MIKLSPSLFTHENRVLRDVLFGIKTSEYKEDVKDLKSTWRALHKHSCDCKGDQSRHHWLHYEGAELSQWDEPAIDDAVDRLGGYFGVYRTVT